MRYTTILAALVVFGCNGKDETPTGETGTTPTTPSETGTTMITEAFTVSGAAIDASNGQPAAEGLCVDLLDPSPALTGGAPLLLLSTTVGTNGAFQFDDVITDSVLGLLMSVKDCATPNTTVFTSATGIPFSLIDGIGTGTVANQTAFVITMPFLAGLQASAAAAGYAGDLSVDGMMYGFAFDSTLTPQSNVTITCTTCTGPTYYLDADPTDGLFTTAAALNTSTSALAGASWMIPAGPIAEYSATGDLTYAPQLNGSQPGSATVTAFFGQ